MKLYTHVERIQREVALKLNHSPQMCLVNICQCKKSILLLPNQLGLTIFFVAGRLEKFERNEESFISFHGEPTYTSLHDFDKAVATLFSGVNLGVVRIVASKKEN